LVAKDREKGTKIHGNLLPNSGKAEYETAVELARGLIPGPTVTFGWGGRTRVVVSDRGPISRFRGARLAPAYRPTARAFRTMIGLRGALISSRPLPDMARPLTSWLPKQIGHLEPR